jgi:hypothetical protein
MILPGFAEFAPKVGWVQFTKTSAKARAVITQKPARQAQRGQSTWKILGILLTYRALLRILKSMRSDARSRAASPTFPVSPERDQE